MAPETLQGDRLQVMTLSSYLEGKEGPPADAWYTNGSSHGTAPHWTAVAAQPSMEILWFGSGSLHHWAELQVVWLFVKCMKKVPYMFIWTAGLYFKG